jgi:ATP-dependent Clp protease ATP-binding subunit ClpB
LDEIEKAHPDVFNILLQVLDDGRLTDGHGRTVDFRNTVIVMTSNLGSEQIQARGEQLAYEDMRAMVMDVVRDSFRPEFINRIDEVVVFHALRRAQIKAIADVQLDLLRRRLADLQIGLEIQPEAVDKLGEMGFDPNYGARPLKRVIQNQLETPLAQALLEGRFGRGDTIKIGLVSGHFEFTQ